LYLKHRINEDLEKKIDKIEKGKNSIEVINNRVTEISKLETNVNPLTIFFKGKYSIRNLI